MKSLLYGKFIIWKIYYMESLLYESLLYRKPII